MTREIPLSQGKVALVDDIDYDRVSRFQWRYARVHTSEYAYLRAKPSIALHRFIMNAPAGTEVDHKDNNGLNNTRDNLRIATHAQNMMNKRPYQRRTKQASQYKGVVWHVSQKWRARIVVSGKRVSLGLFTSELDAARAYNEAAIKYHGEFARLNDLPTP